MDYEYENQRFEGLDLVEQSISYCEFTECEFVDCSFENVEVLSCTFLDCTFVNCRFIHVTGQRSMMRSSVFEDCTLTSIDWTHWVSGSAFYDPFTKLTRCKMKYNQFTSMNLNKFNFSGCEILDSMFGECQLVSSNFMDCNLDKTEFFRCNLSKADFRRAAGYRVDLMTAQLKGAKFSFPEVVNLLYSLGIKIE